MQELNLRQKNESFVQKIKQNHPDYFDELRKEQTPEFFVLSCSDSRVSPSVITEMPLGQMFVHRNIANQVSIEDESFSASLYYALKQLKIKKIIIKGHTDCGGIKAAWADHADEEIKSWLNHIRKSLPNKKGLVHFTVDELAKLNVLKQVQYMKDHPIYRSYGENVDILGCLFHVESGELEMVYP